MPINVHSGIKVETETDFVTADGRMALTRTYVSAPTSGTPLGWGWIHNFERRTRYWGGIENPTRIMMWTGAERALTFMRLGSSGNYYYRPARYNEKVANSTRSAISGLSATSSSYRKTPHPKLERQSNGDYHLILLDGTVEIYSSGFSLRRIEYRGGYTQTMAWANGDLTVTDSFGRDMFFDIDDDTKLLNRVVTPDGQEYQYAYELMANADILSTVSSYSRRRSYGVLKRVTFPDGSEREYEHDYTAMPGYITSIADERGVRVKSTTYEGMKAVSSEGADGRMKFTVAGQGDTSNPYKYTITNPLGQESERSYWKIWGFKEPYQFFTKKMNLLSTAAHIPALAALSITEDWTPIIMRHCGRAIQKVAR